MSHRFAVAGWVVVAAVGVAIGLGGFTFLYARGYAYLTNDPAACANCHIMQGHYDRWLHSSHRSVAVCNQCHTPHQFVGKWLVKGSNGFWHSWAFTTGLFPEPLRIKAGNREVSEAACRSCHAEVVSAIDHGGPRGEPMACTRCHAGVGHPR